MSAIELLPCPFCGGTELSHGHDMGRGVVQCHPCNAYVVVGDEEDSIAAWNRRTDLSQASVAAALEAAAELSADFSWDLPMFEDAAVNEATDDAACAVQEQIAHAIRALITPDQRTALQAAIDAAKAEARAEDAAKIEALVAATGDMKIWLEGALQCKDWVWDTDQYEYAQQSITNYATALAQIGAKP